MTNIYLEPSEICSSKTDAEFHEVPSEELTSKTDNEILTSVSKIDAEVDGILSESRILKTNIEFEEVHSDRVSSDPDNEVITSISKIDAQVDEILSESRISKTNTECIEILSDKTSKLDSEVLTTISKTDAEGYEIWPESKILKTDADVNVQFERISAKTDISKTDAEAHELVSESKYSKTDTEAKGILSESVAFKTGTQTPPSIAMLDNDEILSKSIISSIKTKCNVTLDEGSALEYDTGFKEYVYMSEPNAKVFEICPEEKFSKTEEFEEIVFQRKQYTEADTEFNKMPFNETVSKIDEGFNKISTESNELLYAYSTTGENNNDIESKYHSTWENAESNKTIDMEFQSKKRTPIQNLSKLEMQNLMKRHPKIKSQRPNQRQNLLNFRLKISSQKQVQDLLRCRSKMSSPNQTKSFMKYLPETELCPQTIVGESGEPSTLKTKPGSKQTLMDSNSTTEAGADEHVIEEENYKKWMNKLFKNHPEVK